MISTALTLALAGATLLVALIRSFRGSALALWCVQLALGGLCLQLGAEYLAMSLWLMGTLSTSLLLVFAAVFGNLEDQDSPKKGRHWLSTLGGVLLGGMVGTMLLLGLSGTRAHVESAISSSTLRTGENIQMIGGLMTSDASLVLLEVAVMILLCVVGVGVVARPRVIQGRLPEDHPGGGT